MAKTDTTIDKDLYEGLQQARKKKPRYFALIAKGADVVGLIVQKKVINDGAAQKAKSECKGTLVIQGVCRGEGVELKFEVEGDEPSILPKKIKDFIEEQTELTLKAQWAVVPKLSPVPDEDGQPAADQAPANQPAAAEPVIPPAPPPPPQAAPVDIKALQARLKELLTRQRDLFAKNPAFREKLLKFSQPASSLTMSGSAEAPAALDKLEQALNIAERAIQQPAQPTSQPPTSQPPTSAASEPKAAEPKAIEPTTGDAKAIDPMAEWKQKLAAWLPAIKAAIDAQGPATADLRKLFAEASAMAKAVSLSKPGADIALAIAKLTECHELVKASASRSPTDLAAECKQLKAAIYPLVKAAVDANPGQKDAVIRLLGLADKHEKATEYATAIEAYQELRALLASLPTAGSSASQTDVDLKTIAAGWTREQARLAAKLTEELDWIKSVLTSKNPKVEKLQDMLLKAELELRTLLQRSGGAVQTREQAAEMEHYLSDNDVVAAVCEHTKFDAQPLMAALQPFKSMAA